MFDLLTKKRAAPSADKPSPSRKAEGLPDGAQELIDEGKALMQEAADAWVALKSHAEDLKARSDDLAERFDALLSEAGIDPFSVPGPFQNAPAGASDYLELGYT